MNLLKCFSYSSVFFHIIKGHIIQQEWKKNSTTNFHTSSLQEKLEWSKIFSLIQNLRAQLWSAQLGSGSQYATLDWSLMAEQANTKKMAARNQLYGNGRGKGWCPEKVRWIDFSLPLYSTPSSPIYQLLALGFLCNIPNTQFAFLSKEDYSKTLLRSYNSYDYII